jgi:hypothetical protein
MGEGGHDRLRTGLGLAGGATPPPDSVRESGDAPQIGAVQANSDQAGSMTTVPFEVVRGTEFVFEPFLGSLIQLPAVRMQRARSSEFFLPQSLVQVGETKPSVGSGEGIAWERASAASTVGREENALAAAELWNAASREKSDKEKSSREQAGRRSTIRLPAELKAAMLQIDEQRRQTQEEREKPATEKRRGFLMARRLKKAEAPETAGEIRGLEVKSIRRVVKQAEAQFARGSALSPLTPGIEKAQGAERVIVPVKQEPALPLPVKAAEPELLVSQPASEVTADQEAARAAWEAEEIEPVFAQTKIAEEEKPLKKKERLSLRTRLQRWWGGDSARLDGDRRRAERSSLTGLVAFYWSGGTPKPHEIVNISKTGFYLRTTELWSLETLVRMTLQRPVREAKPKRESISVLARVVRIDKDGVGHEFVTTEALMNARSMDVMPSQGTDWKELDRFLDAG